MRDNFKKILMSHLPRIYFAHNLQAGDLVTLNAEASKHLLQVLRLKCGAKFIIFNNTAGEFVASIKDSKKNLVVAAVVEFVSRNVESPLAIHLGQGIARGEKMDWIIQKSVELGISTITPLFTEYCNVKLPTDRAIKRTLHWQKIAQGASEQSGRCTVPQVAASTNLADWVVAATGLRLVLAPEAKTSLRQLDAIPEQVALLVGPEGGLSPKEIGFAEEHGFVAINLGPRILRTETAALVALSILQYKWG